MFSSSLAVDNSGPVVQHDVTCGVRPEASVRGPMCVEGTMFTDSSLIDGSASLDGSVSAEGSMSVEGSMSAEGSVCVDDSASSDACVEVKPFTVIDANCTNAGKYMRFVRLGSGRRKSNNFSKFYFLKLLPYIQTIYHQ